MTKEFDAVLEWGGTPVAECSCGRTHYVADGKFMEPDGELERLQARTKADPKRCIPRDEGDSIGVTDLNGTTYVWGCECKWADRMESFLWNNRIRIIAYYRKRTEIAQAAVEKTNAAMATLSQLEQP